MSAGKKLRLNSPPGWPTPPAGWTPPKGWTPPPSWPKPPEGWKLWVEVPAEDPEPPTLSVPAVTAGVADGVGLTEVDVLRARIDALESESSTLRNTLMNAGAPAENVSFNDEAFLHEVGIYRYHHPLESAVAYEERLESNARNVAWLIKADQAIERTNAFTFNGSLSKGQKMTKDLAKLMLRAYNAEAENTVRSLRNGNTAAAKSRLEKSRSAIAKLGSMMEMRIADRFHALRIEEVELVADFMMKKQEEKEAQLAERARLREEKKVAEQLAAERERLEKEKGHLVKVMERLSAKGAPDAALEAKLKEVEGAIAQNDFRAANIRAGYVYVISNRGAFGGHVVKIGLTRRLDPQERIFELGDASVPFRFDIHALYFSQDAVTLERELHEYFEDRRLNWANVRREFFFATPREVKMVLSQKVGNLLEFFEHVESLEYLQSTKYWPAARVPPQPNANAAQGEVPSGA